MDQAMLPPSLLWSKFDVRPPFFVQALELNFLELKKMMDCSIWGKETISKNELKWLSNSDKVRSWWWWRALGGLGTSSDWFWGNGEVLCISRCTLSVVHATLYLNQGKTLVHPLLATKVEVEGRDSYDWCYRGSLEAKRAGWFLGGQSWLWKVNQ